MSESDYRLTHKFIEKVCHYLRAGVFESVASEIAGVPYSVFQQWLARGQKKGERGLYRKLYQEVFQAKAHARFVTESKMRLENPRCWLLHGPGKETPQTPGWSAAPPGRADDVEIDKERIIAEVLALIQIVLKALEPYPEARIAAAEAIEPVGQVFNLSEKKTS